MRDIFGARETGLDERETRLHKKYEHTGKQYPHRIQTDQSVGNLFGGIRSLRQNGFRRQEYEDDGKQHRKNARAFDEIVNVHSFASECEILLNRVQPEQGGIMAPMRRDGCDQLDRASHRTFASNA
jgi:hypothetical protein